MRNSCEGVIESQAIAWFAQGCRYGSELWMKLQRKMPITLAEMIRIADSYALGDPTQPRTASNESNEEYYQRDGAGHPGGTITEEKEEMIDRIIATVRKKLQL